MNGSHFIQIKVFSHTELQETTNKILMVAGRLPHAMFLQKAGLSFYLFLKVSVKMTTFWNNSNYRSGTLCNKALCNDAITSPYTTHTHTSLDQVYNEYSNILCAKRKKKKANFGQILCYVCGTTCKTNLWSMTEVKLLQCKNLNIATECQNTDKVHSREELLLTSSLSPWWPKAQFSASIMANFDKTTLQLSSLRSYCVILYFNIQKYGGGGSLWTV